MAKNGDKPQIDKFRDAARELGIGDTDDAFEAALAKIANAPKLTDEEIKALAKKQRDEKAR